MNTYLHLCIWVLH